MGARIEVHDRTHWHSLRRGCLLTASTIPALLCEDFTYTTPYRLFLQATGRLPYEDDWSSPAMDAGTDAELMMPARVQRQRPNLVLLKNRDFFIHDTLPFGGTPDFFGQDESVWEGKCVDPDVFRFRWRERPPAWVNVQLHANYLLTNAPGGGIVALLRDGGFTTHVWDMAIEPALIRQIEDEFRRFAFQVQTNTWYGSIDYYRDADTICEANAVAVPLSHADMTGHGRLYDIMRELTYAQEQSARLNATITALRAETVAILGTIESATCGEYVVTAKTVQAKGKKPHRRLTVKKGTMS